MLTEVPYEIMIWKDQINKVKFVDFLLTFNSILLRAIRITALRQNFKHLNHSYHENHDQDFYFLILWTDKFTEICLDHTKQCWIDERVQPNLERK